MLTRYQKRVQAQALSNQGTLQLPEDVIKSILLYLPHHELPTMRRLSRAFLGWCDALKPHLLALTWIPMPGPFPKVHTLALSALSVQRLVPSHWPRLTTLHLTDVKLTQGLLPPSVRTLRLTRCRVGPMSSSAVTDLSVEQCAWTNPIVDFLHMSPLERLRWAGAYTPTCRCGVRLCPDREVVFAGVATCGCHMPQPWASAPALCVSNVLSRLRLQHLTLADWVWEEWPSLPAVPSLTLTHIRGGPHLEITHPVTHLDVSYTRLQQLTVRSPLHSLKLRGTFLPWKAVRALSVRPGAVLDLCARLCCSRDTQPTPRRVVEHFGTVRPLYAAVHPYSPGDAVVLVPYTQPIVDMQIDLLRQRLTVRPLSARLFWWSTLQHKSPAVIFRDIRIMMGEGPDDLRACGFAQILALVSELHPLPELRHACQQVYAWSQRNHGLTHVLTPFAWDMLCQ